VEFLDRLISSHPATLGDMLSHSVHGSERFANWLKQLTLFVLANIGLVACKDDVLRFTIFSPVGKNVYPTGVNRKELL
jgi:hypothetical protein